MQKLIKEFKEFALGGNLVEVAVGLVMALALKTLVDSLITHVIMPIVGILFGEPSFDRALILTINDSEIRFGSFLSSTSSRRFGTLWPRTNYLDLESEGPGVFSGAFCLVGIAYTPADASTATC